MDLYSKEIQQIFWGVKWPLDLKILITEGTDNLNNPVIWLILSRENFESFDGEVKRAIAGQIGRIMEQIRKRGAHILLEVVSTDKILKEIEGRSLE